MPQPSPRDWERIARLARSDDSPRDPFGERGDHLPYPEEYTDAQPGGQEKLAILEARVQGLPAVRLFHPCDVHRQQDWTANRAVYRMAVCDNGHNKNAACQLFDGDQEGLEDYFDQPFARAASRLAATLTAVGECRRLAVICWGETAFAVVDAGQRVVGRFRFTRPEKPFRCQVYARGPSWGAVFTKALQEYPTRQARHEDLADWLKRQDLPAAAGERSDAA